MGINSLQVQPGRAVSVGIYLRHLVGGLAKVDEEAEYLIFVSPGTAGSFRTGNPHFREVVCPGTHLGRPIRILYEQLFLPGLLRRLGVDVLFSPENSAPLNLPCRSVLGIQMMMMFTMPEYFPSFTRKVYFRYMMKRAAAHADRVVCVSDSIRREVSRYLSVPEGKMVVIPEAPAEFFRPMDLCAARAEVARSFGVGGPYLLCVAIMAPYKNLVRLVEAFGTACRKANLPHQLLIAGGEDAWPGYRAKVEKAVERCGLAGRVRLLGRVEHSNLVPLYSAADALVFPSLCESFGLPVVEAMACGCPVITSDYTCLPETAGGAALLVDPYSVESIAEAIVKVATSEDLRAHLRQAGLERAAKLSWTESGRRLSQLFREVCAVGEA
ncbi:MAG: glycosyltransferase family 4 protein [Armatimonadota bacterium]